MLFTSCNIILNEDVRGKLTQNSQQIKIQLNEFYTRQSAYFYAILLFMCRAAMDMLSILRFY